MKPHVTRDSLPNDREIVTMYCEDSPARPGNEPQDGDSDFTLQFPLHDGRRLELHAGKETHAHFVAILAAMETDEAEDLW